MLKTILSRREFSLLGVILLLGIVISFRQPRFLAASNIYDIVNARHDEHLSRFRVRDERG